MGFVGCGNLVVSWIDPDLIFFITYVEDPGYCITSSYYSTCTFLFSFFKLIGMCRLADICFSSKDSFRTGLNRRHQDRVRKFPFLIVPFVVVSAASIGEGFLPDDWSIWVRYAESFLTIIFMNFFLCFLVVIPIKEALRFPLKRGSLTKRHGKWKDVEDSFEDLDVEGMENAAL
jgi:hypothetical protein